MHDGQLYQAVLGALMAAFVCGIVPAHVAAAFFLSGTVIYYGSLQAAGVSATGALTGLVFGVVGTGAILRKISQRHPTMPRALAVCVCLFVMFVLDWYWRWLSLPPPPSAFTEFSDRVYEYMLVFGVVAFLCGASLGRKDAHGMLVTLAVQGAASAGIVLILWASGVDHAEAGSLRWLPLESLSGIWLSFDLGIGLLSFLAVTAKKEGALWFTLRAAMVALVLAIDVKLDERGPVLFLLAAIFLGLLVHSSSRGASRFRAAIRALAIVGAVAGVIVSVDESRATRFDSYTFEGEANANRIDLVQRALAYWSDSPLLGSGGALVGRSLDHDTEWQYSHVWLLDSLVETGAFGAALQWSLVLVTAGLLLRRWRAGREGGAAVAKLLPLLFYVFAENQVGGHVSLSKHLWFMLGLACAVSTQAEQALTTNEAERAAGWAALTARPELDEIHCES